MANSHTKLSYHIVIGTKERHHLIKPNLAERLHAYLASGLHANGGTTITINGTTNHVHLLARLKPDKSLSDVMRSIKANSSKWIHQTFPLQNNFAWQDGYAAFTVSESQLQRVRTYIDNQQKHHQQTTFEEELQTLLQAHDIPFDPQHF
jgi:putative transposase